MLAGCIGNDDMASGDPGLIREQRADRTRIDGYCTLEALRR